MRPVAMMASGRAATRQLVGDLGIGVGQRQDDRIGRHALQHRAASDGWPPRGRRTRRRRRRASASVRLLGRRTRTRCLYGFIFSRAALVDDAHWCRPSRCCSRCTPSAHVQLRAAQCAAAPAPQTHDLHVIDALADEVERVEERGRGDDGRAVLVVVEDRDRHPLASFSSM